MRGLSRDPWDGKSILMPRDCRATARARKRWRDARAFQLDVQAALASASVQFTEWLLLETVKELVDETQSPMSQSAIAERAGLTRQVASYWLGQMTETGFVDRAPEGDGRSWGVLLTELGERALVECNERLEAAGLTG